MISKRQTKYAALNTRKRTLWLNASTQRMLASSIPFVLSRATMRFGMSTRGKRHRTDQLSALLPGCVPDSPELDEEVVA